MEGGCWLNEKQESEFMRGKEHKKCNLLEMAFQAGNSLIYEALIELQITGDIRSRGQQYPK